MSNVPPFDHRRILVVDDNPAIHADIRKILCPEGKLDPSFTALAAEIFDEAVVGPARADFEIESAFQGQEGLQMVRAAISQDRPFSLAFVDVRMPPGWDGIETISHICKEQPDLQIIICTAYSDYSWEDMVRKIEHSSNLVVLKKPFDNIEVLQMAHALTEKWRLNQQVKQDISDLDRMVAQRTSELRDSNEKLQLESAERRKAEDDVRTLNADLEQRVQQRTAELSAANRQLDQASRLKDEFLANMSHELRTPLNAILGLSEALLEHTGGELSPRQARSIGTISTSGQHLLALINDILDLSKIEAGKLDLNSEPLDPTEFCESCLAFVRTQAMHKNIRITFESRDDGIKIAADPKRLKQILVNLLSNAVKFTPEGGEIGLVVSVPPEEDAVRFTVWDNGIGISPADQPKLFQAFTQIDSGLSRAQEGTGLGLAMVAKLVELHGGSVTLESEPNRGSRFMVTLPSPSAEGLPAPVGTVAPFAHAPAIPRAFRRALIIDDDPNASEIIERYLTEFSITTILHVRGEQSVEVALSERPDFILLDIMLPNENGWIVLTRLMEHPGTRNIPVIITSIIDEPRKSLALGAVAHFTKPVTREQLAKFLHRDPHRASPSESSPPSSAPSPGPVVLLAEDNEANIQTVGDYLDDKGYVMHYARNGLLAVQAARRFRPDIILMDIQMPVMDGLTAIKEIQSDPALRHIPIIALTALAMPEDRERCIAAGATDYLSKPVRLKKLVALIENLHPETPPTNP
ncbi:response regulator [Synoicihabitans lomoniglobus]|uniref:histidine kinase n=1 Tax=Synoicihabitans lomoniglobus TaxID=2909285 RepID=A0AAF0I2P4_9BACT|nr:response regulator [Opitutaceae bacterium LMO-M01]WED65863.1 response regulator [Opitutaceae bacterium LMO-M01]